MVPLFRQLSVIGLLTLVGPSTFAIPLQILSRSRLSLQLIKQLDERYLELDLKDDRGRGLSDRSIRIRIGTLGALVRKTTSDGSLRVAESQLREGGIALERREYRVTVTFDGDPDNSPAEDTKTLNFGQEAVTLDWIDLARRVDVGGRPLIAQARLRSSGLGLSAHVLRLMIGRRRVGEATTDSRGVARFVVKPGEFPRPGRTTLSVHYAGNDFYAAAKSTAIVDFFEKTTLTLVAGVENQNEKARRRLVASGRLLAGARPLVGRTVTLVDGRRRISATKSDAFGRYRIVLGPHEIPTGRLRLAAIYRSESPAIASARSKDVRLFVPTFPSIPLRYYLLPLLLLLPLGAYLAIRRAPWTRWLRWLRRRLRPAEQRSPELLRVLRPQVIESAPIDPASSRQRAATEHEVVGQAWDAIGRHPIAGVAISVIGNAGEMLAETETDAHGRFSLGRIPSGRHRLSSRHAEYADESVPITLPHRGQLIGFRFNMLPLRALLLASYRELLDHAFPARQVWGVDTPREALRLLMERLPKGHAELRQATDVFEHLYYGDRSVVRHDVDDFRSRTRALQEVNR